MEMLINIGFGLAGIVVFVVWTSRKLIMTPTFTLKMHFKQNWKRWSWSITMLTILTILVTAEPKLSDAIKAFLGIDMANERGAFFSTGLALAGLVKGVVKKSSDMVKEEKTT